MTNYAILSLGLALALWGIDKSGVLDKGGILGFLRPYVAWAYIIIGIILAFIGNILS